MISPILRSQALALPSAFLASLLAAAAAAATTTIECGLFRDYVAPDPIGVMHGQLPSAYRGRLSDRGRRNARAAD
jgi:hypothetical protein